MRLITSLLLTLAIGQAAFGEAPSLQLQMAPVQKRVRAHRITALSLLGGGALLTTTGGLLIGYHDQADSKLDSGIALTAVGGAAMLASLYAGIETAGRDSGVHDMRALANVPVVDRLMLMDEAESKVRHQELVSLGFLIGGLVLFGGGFAMAIEGIGNPCIACEGQVNDSGNAALAISGMVISVAGDALWTTGSGMLTYYAGKRAGIRDARRVLNFSATGVGGTF